MQSRRILIFGDSNGLPRPEISAEQTYPSLLTQLLGYEWVVENHSIGGTTTKALYERWKVVGPGDVVVIQTGITEGAPRPIPWWLRRVVGRLGPLKKPIVKYLHDNRERLLRRKAYFMTSPEEVERVVAQWVREAPRTIVVLVPGSVGEEMERRSPGAQAAYANLNDRLRTAGQEDCLDLGKISLLEDAHHFDGSGHEEVAKRIKEKLQESYPESPAPRRA